MTQFIRSSKKEAMNFLRYIGPGLLVTVGFIDPGNWASNIAAGSGYGYTLLWMVTLSTIMLIILQHNAAHLGIVTGKCLSEATSLYINKRLKNTILLTAVAASIATAMAELLGGAMALEMLFHLPVKIGTFIILGIVSFTKMTTDLLPSMELPYAIVMTTYQGASPETVETTVTKPVEQSMATISNIKEVNSISSENMSMVILEFEGDTDTNSVWWTIWPES